MFKKNIEFIAWEISLYKDFIGDKFKYIPPSGEEMNDFGQITTGIFVRAEGENSKLLNNRTRPIFACIIPKRRPMHLRGPVIWWLDLNNHKQYLWNNKNFTFSKWQPRHWISLLHFFGWKPIRIELFWTWIIFWISMDLFNRYQTLLEMEIIN